MNETAVRIKALEDFLDDPMFWERWRTEFAPVVGQVFGVLVRDGMEAGRDIAPIRVKQLNPDPEALNAAAERIIATYTDAWWQQFSEATQRMVRDAIDQARVEGTGTEGVIRALEPIFGAKRAEIIAITETTRLFALGAQATYALSGLEFWSWQTVRDFAVCPICRPLQGRVFSMDVPFTPAHPRCVVAGTSMSSARLVAATARTFHGPGIVLRTAFGDELTVTPNHPILTPAGWIAAGSLREGDHVAAEVGDRPAPTVGPHDVEMPAPVEQIAGALFRAGGMFARRMPQAPEDFHGDGIDGYVDVVDAHRLLGLDRPARVFQLSDKDRFQWRLRPPACDRPCPQHLFPFGMNATAGRFVGRSGQPPPLLGRGLSHAEEHGVATVPYRYVRLAEAASNGESGHAVTDGYGLLGDAPQVLGNDRLRVEGQAIRARFCRLSEVRRIWIEGQVYNLETESGWYTANGIVTHNCRCFTRPVIEPSRT